MEMVGEVTVGQLLKAVLEFKEKTAMFRPTMKLLESTLQSLTPVIKQIEEYYKLLDRSEKEIESLLKLMKDGNDLVCKCSKIPWWDILRKKRYQEKLEVLDKLLKRFLQVDLPVLMARNQMQILLNQNCHSKRDVGAVIEELVSAVKKLMKEKAKAMTVNFRGRLEELEATLEAIAPVIKEMIKQNTTNELNGRHMREIERLIRLMEKVKKLVSKCSKIQRWSKAKEFLYLVKLRALHTLLVRFFQVDMQAQKVNVAGSAVMEGISSTVVTSSMAPFVDEISFGEQENEFENGTQGCLCFKKM